ncbi:hypothetical protein [Hymenobacter swuensis]|uniref:DUF4369 domain-containing protein n=1 Tax=Hymenobacter swuensis DY53 TaxID=1227739 RepID=W8F0P2_9BACT|nr:hypothetical protein [Hymenobacter swuensis]AHJ98463.1 hypothetical protein Hsw_2868 [Hymenobacter swuensis DY53]
MVTFTSLAARALLLAAVLFLTACGATSFLNVSPTRPDGPWVNGHPTSFFSHPDSVYVRLGFIRAEERELVFETDIQNYSDHPIRISPETFYYMALPDTLADTVAAPAQYFEARVLAADPELRLAQLKAKLAKEAQKAENVSWFEILTLATHAVEDVASIKKKETAEQIAEREYRHQSDNAYFDEQRETHAQNADNLYSTTRTLETVALRHDTLQPGQRMTGQLYFPRLDAARKLRVVVFFDERPVQFNFTQHLKSY